MKLFIAGILLFLVGCSASKIIVLRHMMTDDYPRKTLGILPIEPGMFVDADLLDTLDINLPVYFKSKTSFGNVAAVPESLSRRQPTITRTLPFKGHDSLSFTIPDSLYVNNRRVDYLLAIGDFQIQSKHTSTPIPLAVVPLPGVTFVAWANVKGTRVDCSFQFALWDYALMQIVSYGRIKGKIAQGYFNRLVYNPGNNSIALFDEVVRKSLFVK